MSDNKKLEMWRIWMVADQNYVLIKSQLKETDGTWILTDRSVEWKNVSRVNNIVRAHLVVSILEKK